ncbi:hypothetical protein F4553_001763 [Allocatelliglobosispora scoriae]|uniref:SGNH hydrolase-type esterase domain-containing protein n=1 Tax=Allocatelliglobosispora scoriae TaxID=643052 RepID=A0A841BJF7_9ACTN|nr:GDSL-type esterase/lipase family protein [Allocatelliglobosispora scoriae]MBB5868384.1 hypothetical protein [Allocatelliglobosispora scoriae]
MRLFSRSTLSLLTVLMVAVTQVVVAEASAAAVMPSAASASVPARDAADTTRIRASDRAEILGTGWASSADRAWRVDGDAAGLHVLVAAAAEGYAWRTAATLAEPGFGDDMWIGNACVTASGRRLAVAYAPRLFTNDSVLQARGAFTAIVDLISGEVAKLPFTATLAYYSPGCGEGEAAVFTQTAGDHALRTRLIRVNTATAKPAPPIDLDGQVTSAVPVAGAIVAADSARLVRVDATGRRSVVARTNAVPFKITAAADGSLAFLDRDGDTALVRRLADARSAVLSTVATGALTEIDLTRDAAGRPIVTGEGTRAAGAGAVVLSGAPKGALASTLGQVLTWTERGDPRVPDADPQHVRTTGIQLRSSATGRSARFEVRPGTRPAAPGAGSSRSGTRSGAAPTLVGSPSNPVEAERTCSVPRNDAWNQVMQPKPRQVEWAVDQAVRNVLTVARPANWKNLGMPAYTPQGLFPPVGLSGGGYVPAQVMLGIAAQESNLWQATGRALPGMTGNPLVGNFYGREIYDADPGNDWDIHWSGADCGYGIMQFTDGMRLAGRERPGETALPYDKQRAVALDFATNVAAGLQLLQQKWNQTRGAGLTVNNGDPKYLENWFFAIWAYNSGFHADQGDGSAWGVGWLNNPANPNYPANRSSFLDTTMADAAHPQDWPYPEKVLGFAGHPIELPEAPGVTVAAFRPAVWNGGPDGGPINRRQVKPPVNQFCDTTNNCVPGGHYLPDDPGVVGEPAGPCAHQNPSGQYDLKCWYHRGTTWKADCVQTCGYELLRFDPGYAYQDDGTSYPPRCDVNGLPPGTVVIDDIPANAPIERPNCGRPFTDGGSFTFTFGADAAGNYPSKADTHQFGAGFEGHFYSSFGRGAGYSPPFGEPRMRVTGTWRATQAVHGYLRVKVALPDVGATERLARYDIDLGNGQTRFRVIPQRSTSNTWWDLGTFRFDGIPAVSLSTYTVDGYGDHTVAWDAVALVPSVQPSASYVAMGDSYSSGEGLAPYRAGTDIPEGDPESNTCHRAQRDAYPSQVKVPGHSTTIEQEAAAGNANFAFIACSGAKTTNITRTAYNSPPSPGDAAGHTDWGMPAGTDERRFLYNGELPQVEQGYLDVDTTLVTLSVGGNDARFTEVIRGCALSLQLCFDDAYHLTRGNGVVDPDPMKVYEKALIREQLGTHLKAAYHAIHAKAPNATIVVLAYPQLFEDFATINTCALLTPDKLNFLNTFADLLTIAIGKAVREVKAEGIAKISYVNTTQRWRDGVNRWPCGPATLPVPAPWTYPVIPGCFNGGIEVPCKASFHPTVPGHVELADLVNTQLRGHSTASQIQAHIEAYAQSRTDMPQWTTLTAPQAAVIAQLCLDYTFRGGVVGDPCMTDAILVPTTNDARGAAENDDFALQRNPAWVELNYTSGAQKKALHGITKSWMNNNAYRPNVCPVPRKDYPEAEFQCDEYPFYASRLGGAWDFYETKGIEQFSESSTSLRMIPGPENLAEGRLISQLVSGSRCNFTSWGTPQAIPGQPPVHPGSKYLTIPYIVADGSAPLSTYICPA